MTQPPADATVPTQTPSATADATDILDGAHAVASLDEAAALLAGADGEALLAAVEPIDGLLTIVLMFVNVIKAMGTEERGCTMRGWCYSVLYGALTMGTPPEPTFQGSLQGADQDQLDQHGWDQGVTTGQQDLANGTAGVAFSNKLLLRVSNDGDPGTTLNALWQAACAQSGDTQLAQAYSSLTWPQPIGA